MKEICKHFVKIQGKGAGFITNRLQNVHIDTMASIADPNAVYIANMPCTYRDYPSIGYSRYPLAIIVF
jgi:hypothetical protein